MADIRIYTTGYCGYCHAAKGLLDTLSVAYEEIDLTGDHQGRMTLVPLAEGRTTVPQIFIDEQSIGGYDDLVGLQRSGRLDSLLEGSA